MTREDLENLVGSVAEFRWVDAFKPESKTKTKMLKILDFSDNNGHSLLWMEDDDGKYKIPVGSCKIYKPIHAHP